MAQATLVVAPIYLAQVTGVTAVQISARKIKLMDATLKTLAECPRRKDDNAAASFSELVALVRGRVASAALAALESPISRQAV